MVYPRKFGAAPIKRNIATASEESITALAAGINTQNYYISHLPGIAANVALLARNKVGNDIASTPGVDFAAYHAQSLTQFQNLNSSAADILVQCRRAADACEKMTGQLGKVIYPKGFNSNYGVNVYLRN